MQILQFKLECGKRKCQKQERDTGGRERAQVTYSLNGDRIR